MSVDFPGAQAAGDLNVVFVGWGDPTRTVTSVTDTAGNTYALAVTGIASSGPWSQSIYYATNIASSASNTVTVTFNAGTFKVLRVLEYSGVSTSSPLDVATSAAGQGTALASGPMTTTASNDLIVVGNDASGCVNSGSTGFTVRSNEACAVVEDEVDPTAGSVTVDSTQDDNGFWVQQMAAFKAAASKTPAFVQAAGSQGPQPGSVFSANLNAAQTAGDLTLVIVDWFESAVTISSVTDKAGNTYQPATTATTLSGFESMQVYYAKNIVAATSPEIDVTFSRSTGFPPEIRVLEYGGLDPTSPIDGVAVATGNDVNATSGPVTTTLANDLLVVANATNACDVGPGTGFTARDTTGCNLVEDAVETTAGSYTITIPQYSSGPYVQQMVALKEATGGGGGGGCQGVPNCSNVDRTVGTTVMAATSFLYSGSNPVQTGVAAGTITPTRAALIRGRVLDTSSNPLAGVTETIVGHPEYGSTASLSDGTFSMAVNGGSALVVDYKLTGFLPMQRTVPAVPWNGYAMAPDVAMTALDTAATAINVSNATGYQVARASTVTDASGTRTATLLVPPGTTAQLSTGGTLTTMTVRATEYTVGPNGPTAMPGTLPATSAYTYALELSADEALAAGASVQFNQPVLLYTDNFLQFGVGEHVPLGFYDRTRGAWVPSPDGLVIGLLSITNGAVNIDINGDGTADSPSALAAVGITSGEQAALATLYTVPTSVWRAPIPHFSPWDPNWPFGPPPGAGPPPGPGPAPPPAPSGGGCHSDDSSGQNASTIECQNGILHESIPIAGTSYSLVYSSDRVAGYTAANRLLVPLSGASLPSGVTEIELDIELAGRSFTSSFPASTNLTTTFDWDGKDAFGRALQGVQSANVSIGYTYNGTYFKPGESPNGPTYDALFGHFSFFGVPATGDRTRQNVTLWSRYSAPIGHWSAEALGLGGWTLDVQNVYEPTTATLRLGTGDIQPADAFGKVVTTIAGTGGTGSSGDNGPATSAQLNQPWNVALAPDGSLYIDDRNNFRIRRVDANGIITTVAGTGSAGFNGDGLAATQSQLNNPEAIAIAPDGSFYIADVANQRVRKVDVNGIMTTVAGTGVSGYAGDGGPATSARLANPNGLFLAPDGSIYIADSVNSVIRKVDPSGTISTVAGTGVSGFNGDGQTATSAQLFNAHSMVLDRDGVMYIGDRVNHRIRRVGVDGIITTIAGTGVSGFSGDGGPAVSAQISEPHSLLLGRDGTLYFSDHFNARIRAIRPDGIITTIAGNGTVGFAGDNGPALDAEFNPGQFIWGLALTADGQFMYVADGNNNRVRRLSLAQPMFSNTAFAVAALNGSEVYGFDAQGRHLRTTALPSNATKVALGYDSNGLVQTLTDGNGNVTTIQRDASGNPTGVASPFGVTTTLALGTDGYLGTVTGPAGATYQMTYQSGLLTAIQFPTGSPTAQSTKTYDSLGRVLTSTDAAGHALTFSRAPDSTTNVSVGKTTTQGVATQYNISLAPSGASTWTNTLPDGTTSTEQLGADGSRIVTSPDGTKTTYQPGPDPRFGMQAPIVASQTIVLPSGLTQTRSTSRTVTLSNPLDPLSLVTESDTSTVNGKTWTTAFNAAQGTFTATTPVGRTTTTTIDAAGHPTQIAMTGIAATSRVYDSHGRLSTTTQGTFLQGGSQVPRTWTTAYDSLGYANSTTDPLNIATTTTNDAAGRATTTLLPDGHGGTRSLLASYDGDDDLTSLTLPSGSLHGLSYSPVDALASYVPPAVSGTGSTQYQYDGDGRIELETRPDSATLSYGYDSAGRLHTTTYPQGTLTRSYDPTTGKLTSLAAPSGVTLAFGYDGMLPKSTTWSGVVTGSLLLGYDATFRMTSQAVNGGTALTFGYDDDNLMTQAGALTVTRDPQNGRVTGSTLGSLIDSYTYDANGMLASYGATFNSTVLYSETIGARDGDGRITQRTEIAGSTTHVWAYTYDTAGRLTDVTEDGTAVSHYGYDADDNRTTFTGASGTIHPTYDAQDRLLTYGSTTYAYGANGELQSKTAGSQTTTYQYDVLGNLLHVAPPSGSALDYVVDGRNRRVGKKVGGTLTSGFLYQDALNVVAQLDGSGNLVARFVFGSKPNVPDYFTTSAGTFRILSDHLGSPRVVVNTASGSIVEQIDYDEFGNVTNDTAPGTIPFGFGGGLYDQNTKLVRFGARDYDATVARWTNKDPTRFQGGINLYGYVVNDPVNQTDASGTGWLCDWFGILCAPVGPPAPPDGGGAGDGGVGPGGGGGGAGAAGPGGGGTTGGAIGMCRKDDDPDDPKRRDCVKECKGYLPQMWNWNYMGNDGHVYKNDRGGAHAYQRCYSECMGYL